MFIDPTPFGPKELNEREQLMRSGGSPYVAAAATTAFMITVVEDVAIAVASVTMAI